MESKENGSTEAGAGLRKSGRLRSRVLRQSPGENKEATTETETPIPQRKRKSTDSESSPPLAGKENNTAELSKDDGEAGEWTKTEVKVRKEDKENSVSPPKPKIKKEPEVSPEQALVEKEKKKRGRKPKSSNLTPTVDPKVEERNVTKVAKKEPEAEEAKKAPEVAVTPKPKKAPEVAVTPKPKKAPEVAVTPKSKKALEVAVTPKPKKAPEVAVTPKPEKAPEVAVTTPKVNKAPEVVGTPKTKKALEAGVTKKALDVSAEPEPYKEEETAKVTESDRPATLLTTPAADPGAVKTKKVKFAVPEPEEEIQWTDAPGRAFPVIWGEQIKNSIDRLTNLKFFQVGSSTKIKEDPDQLEGVEVEVKPKQRRASGKRAQSTGGGAKGGKGKKKKAQAQDTTTVGSVFTFSNGTFVAGNGAGGNFKVDALFSSDVVLGGMEGMEIVVQQQQPEQEGRDDGAEPSSSNGTNNADGTLMRDDEYFAVVAMEGEVMLDNVASYENVLSTEGVENNRPLSYSAYKKKKRQSAPEGSQSTINTSDPVSGKPNNTYTEIIGKALEENPNGLTVSEIYDWISTKYPYYHPTDDRWKNSVRHNLSISPYFYKGDKSTNGAGHVWTLAEHCKDSAPVCRKHASCITPGSKGGRASGRLGSFDLSGMKTDEEMAVKDILERYQKAIEVPEPEDGYEDVVISSEGMDDGSHGGVDHGQQLSRASMDKNATDVTNEVDVTIHDMAVQPGFTINLDDLFAAQMGYSLNLPLPRSVDSDKENANNDMTRGDSPYALMALDQAQVPAGPHAEPVLDYGAYGRESKTTSRTLSDLGTRSGPSRDISLAGSAVDVIDQMDINTVATQPMIYDNKDDYTMSVLFDDSGMPIFH